MLLIRAATDQAMSSMVHTRFINFYLRTLTGLITQFKEFSSSGTHIVVSQILHILYNHANKPIPDRKKHPKTKCPKIHSLLTCLYFYRLSFV